MAPSAVSVEAAPIPQSKQIVPRSNNAEKKELTALQAISQGVALPSIPLFSSHDKHRAWILNHMAGAFRVFARKGFTEGMSGHISVRDPEHSHMFWTNPLSRHFALMEPPDMVLLDYDGKVVGGNTKLPANAAGFQIHSHIHKARPDVHAACHCHGKAGKAWSAFNRKLEMINQDVTYFYGDAQALYTEFGGVVLNEAEGQRLAASLGPKGKGLILRNHGLLTVGSTVDEAAYLYTLMERSCEVQLMVEAAAANGIPKVYVDDEAASYTYEMSSDPEALYWEFQNDLQYEQVMSNGAFEV